MSSFIKSMQSIETLQRSESTQFFLFSFFGRSKISSFRNFRVFFVTRSNYFLETGGDRGYLRHYTVDIEFKLPFAHIDWKQFRRLFELNFLKALAMALNKELKKRGTIFDCMWLHKPNQSTNQTNLNPLQPTQRNATQRTNQPNTTQRLNY